MMNAVFGCWVTGGVDSLVGRGASLICSRYGLLYGVCFKKNVPLKKIVVTAGVIDVFRRHWGVPFPKSEASIFKQPLNSIHNIAVLDALNPLSY